MDVKFGSFGRRLFSVSHHVSDVSCFFGSIWRPYNYLPVPFSPNTNLAATHAHGRKNSDSTSWPILSIIKNATRRRRPHQWKKLNVRGTRQVFVHDDITRQGA